ncbi:MAG: DNA repair protein RadC [Peptostreptococcaceae bacterium]|nr:DNA repair protein RadC [Peptostreptococcaceae bacterium]
MRIKDIDIQERPREKLIALGASSLSEEELLAIIVGSGTQEHSALGLAKMIIHKAKGIKGLADITMSELIEIKGIKNTKATKIYAALELSRRISKARGVQRYNIDSPESVADIFMEELRYSKKEIVKLLLLDTKGGIVGDVTLSEGSLNSSIVHPREVFREAVVRAANKLILVHNHPSGDPEPSDQDIRLTERISEAGKIMGIELIDHIIIGDGEYASLKRLGYL